MTGRPRWLRRLPPHIRKTAQRDRSSYDAERKALLAVLRAEAANERASAFAVLAAEYASKIAAARSRYQGNELLAALDAIHAERQAAERALAMKLDQAARARRRVVLAGLRERRKARRKEFRTAAHIHVHRSPPAPQAHTKERAPLRRRRAHTTKPRH